MSCTRYFLNLTHILEQSLANAVLVFELPSTKYLHLLVGVSGGCGGQVTRGWPWNLCGLECLIGFCLVRAVGLQQWIRWLPEPCPLLLLLALNQRSILIDPCPRAHFK